MNPYETRRDLSEVEIVEGNNIWDRSGCITRIVELGTSLAALMCDVAVATTAIFESRRAPTQADEMVGGS